MVSTTTIVNQVKMRDREIESLKSQLAEKEEAIKFYHEDVQRKAVAIEKLQAELELTINTASEAQDRVSEYETILNDNHFLLKQNKKLQAELDELKKDQGKCWCAFCADNIERTWEELQAHMKECEKHPLFITNQQLAQKQAEVDELNSVTGRSLGRIYELEFQLAEKDALIEELKKEQALRQCLSCGDLAMSPQAAAFLELNKSLETKLAQKDALIAEARVVCKLVTEDTSYALVYARMFLDKTRAVE